MITPTFDIKQNDECITVKVFAPNALLDATEVVVDENEFLFTSPPYFLRIYLPNDLQSSEKDGCSAHYDADSRSYIIECKKKIPGEHFPKLDMLTDLLIKKKSTSTTQPKIEVISSTEANENTDEAKSEIDIEKECLKIQKLNEEASLLGGYKYGFANNHSGVPAINEMLYGVLDLPDPRSTSPEERKSLRSNAEERHFNPHHYLADLNDGSMSEAFINFVPEYMKINSEQVEYTHDEEIALVQLPRKEVLVEKAEEPQIMAGLVSILLSWCYNHRITDGENCPESAWNVAKLTPMLCWFDAPVSLKDCLRVFCRRVACYPLLRHFESALVVRQDVLKLLSLGKKQILKVLLEIRKMFTEAENYYLLIDLYIIDYCIWIQGLSCEKFADLSKALLLVEVTKEDVGFQLTLLESVGRECHDDDDDLEAATNDLGQLTLANPCTTEELDVLHEQVDDSSHPEEEEDDDDSSSSSSSDSDDSSDDSSTDDSDSDSESLDSDDSES